MLCYCLSQFAAETVFKYDNKLQIMHMYVNESLTVVSTQLADMGLISRCIPVQDQLKQQN